MSDMVAMYKGRPASELTREELIEAYAKVVRQLDDERRFAISAAALDAELERTRRFLASVR